MLNKQKSSFLIDQKIRNLKRGMNMKPHLCRTWKCKVKNLNKQKNDTDKINPAKRWSFIDMTDWEWKFDRHARACPWWWLDRSSLNAYKKPLVEAA